LLLQLKEFWTQIFGETFFNEKNMPFTFKNQRFQQIQGIQTKNNLISGKVQLFLGKFKNVWHQLFFL
jgi:hypothetical protein